MFASAPRPSPPIFALLALAALATFGCGPKRVDWLDGDRVIGSILIERDGAGEDDVFKHSYQDLSGRRMRIERRDDDGRLLPRFAIQSFDYDDVGSLSGIRFTHAGGALRIGPPGYARLAIERRTTPEARIEERTYYGPTGARIMIPEGYSRVETTERRTRPGLRQRFFDERDEGICPTIDDEPEVCEVRFDYLQGVTPLTYKTLVSSEGKPLRKTRISGLIELDTATRTTNIPYGDGSIQLQETTRTGN